MEARRQETVELLLQNLSSKEPRVKYGAAKSLVSASKDDPAVLYPHFEAFKELLDSSNSILKWNAINIIGNLSSVDIDKKVPPLLPRLYSLLNCGKLITAGNAISALVNIAGAYPEFRQEITDELLKVEHYNYDTDECRNIAVGFVLVGIASYAQYLTDKQKAVELAQRQTHNTRNATAKKAEAFLKMHAA